MANDRVFQGQLDRFKGVTVNSNEEAKLNVEEFSEKLKNSIQKWRSEVGFGFGIVYHHKLHVFMIRRQVTLNI